MKCFYCGKEIEGNDFQIIALDRPYVNIYVHRDKCFEAIASEGELIYLQKNAERVYQLTSNSLIKKGKKK